jgi:fused signal recognition particle receptor
VPFAAKPWVVFVVGVNGVGKTTTIGKLAAAWKRKGRTTLRVRGRHLSRRRRRAARGLGAAHGAPFHRGREGADPSSVLTDALRIARSKGYDAVLVDTAGRLHTKGNLMAELAKMARVAGREVPGAPHETLLVLDATLGSNALNQGREFAKAGA